VERENLVARILREIATTCVCTERMQSTWLTVDLMLRVFVSVMMVVVVVVVIVLLLTHSLTHSLSLSAQKGKLPTPRETFREDDLVFEALRRLREDEKRMKVCGECVPLDYVCVCVCVCV
jgi:hypothetical protein